ncbi:MAG: AMP-binding protein, partial [Deltaproteobacteria bacterium]|nr:AMP-binding protein [Deltaproteobacteria bacterium]
MLEDNLIGFIIKNANEMPDTVAIREMRYGVWSPMTWLEFKDNVQRFALGLIELGFKKDDKLCVIGDNKPEWIIAEFGTMA